MQEIKSEQIICVDIDSTLLLWDAPMLGASYVKFSDPYDGEQKWVAAHLAHIKILKDRKARGATILVWSQSGHAWAKAAIEALKLEPWVDFVASKPIAIIDDLPASEWLQERIYLSPTSQYGKSAK